MNLTSKNNKFIIHSEKLSQNISVAALFESIKEDNYSVLLESSLLPNGKTSRFSIIPVMPELFISLENGIVTVKDLQNKNLADKSIKITDADESFSILNNLIDNDNISFDNSEIELPFYGGLIGYFSYDFVRYIEKIPEYNPISTTPDFEFVLAKNAVIIDHLDRILYILAENEAILQIIQNKIILINQINEPAIELKPLTNYKDSFSKEEFIEAVETIKEYIAAGEIYQANISILFQSVLKTEPFQIYQLLYNLNPSPFSSYINFNSRHIICNSPERLIKCDHKKVAETRPIAGTRARGTDTAEDNKLTLDLIKSAKERSEHIMLVDLERNDLGKVSQYGTVIVDELFTIEKYSHVMHIVSNVKSQVSGKHNNFDLFKSVFPGGTITGVPKIRCMEIIEEVEPVRRGIYTGSVGYFDFKGNMDFNIIIRTMELDKQEEDIYLAKMQFGAGIVADSVGEHEYKECLKKGKAIFQILNRLS